MSQGRDTTIEDAGHRSPAPGLSGAELKAFRAARGLSEAMDAVESHSGARIGPEYEAKTDAFRKAFSVWRNAMRRAVKGTK